jgi:hypothetical protein
MTEPATDAVPHAPPAACENCGSVLQGHYCHVCGQRAHNPLRSFAHAVEEVFESLWHLDGRIFRTTRELFIPGRVAANYLAGHRVRYIAPLRLFVILSLITFFVGKLTLHIDPGAIRTDLEGARSQGIVIDGEAAGDQRYAAAASADEVMAIRGKALAQLEEARRSPESRWILSLVGGIAQREILEGAQQRLRALGADEALIRAAGDPNHAVPSAAPAPAPAPAPAAKTTAANALDPGANAESAAAAPEVAAAVQDDGLLARWWSRRVERMEANAAAIERDPDTMIRLFLGALPGALFLLVPLFALLLKLVHVRSGRGYLEHLVVALYSHAFMLAALLLVFLLIGARGLSAAPLWQGMLALASTALLLIGIPLYLLLMQKRVYAQGWFRTLAKYGVLGVCYGFLLLLGIVYAVLAGLSS